MNIVRFISNIIQPPHRNSKISNLCVCKKRFLQRRRFDELDGTFLIRCHAISSFAHIRNARIRSSSISVMFYFNNRAINADMQSYVIHQIIIFITLLLNFIVTNRKIVSSIFFRK